MKLRFTLAFLLCCISNFLLAQKIDITTFKNLKIRNLGPAGMSGRVTAIDVVLANPAIIYIGTASGGVWKSENEGITWKPVFDDQPVQSIGSVTINQQNPDEIWVGTGEGNPRNSYSCGAGIYKSLDAGNTWKLMGLKETKSIHRIIINKDDPAIVYVAAMGSAWGPNKERGVYRTSNGGKTWDKILYVNPKTGVADLVVDPANPNKLFAALWEHERKPWFFTSGGEGSGLYVSIDGGDSWVKRTEKDGLPKGELGRIGLAVAPSDSRVVYALIESKKNGLYKSIDGGKKWTLISTENIGNRPFYYADIFVDPKNENRLYNLYSLVSKSEDGGKTFEVILPYSGVHPDHHAFWIHPQSPDFLIEGNDGGLNISHDRGKNWRFIENIPVGQFYHINLDLDTPYHVYGGMQDNGSWVGPAYLWQYGGIRNSDWQEVLFGDGFDVMPYPKDSRYGYAMYQGGNLYRYDKVTGQKNYIQPTHPNSETLRFNWNGAMAQDPFEADGLYFGSQFVHKSTDRGETWDLISPDLTTNDTSKQKQDVSGGLTIDATRAENYTTVSVVAPSILDKNVIWVGTDDGNIQLTRDGGKSWNNLASNIKDFPKGAWVTQIEVSKHTKGEVFVVVNDYRRNNWKPYVYKTVDYGKKWTRLVDETKVEGHCHALVQDIEVPDLLFLGTEFGLYISFNSGQSWEKWKKGFPAVPTVDLKIHPREGDLLIGTFGRAAFILDDIGFLREIARNKNTLQQNFKVFPIPAAYLSRYKRPSGSRFIADAEFEGDNRSAGAMITFWVKEIAKNDTADQNKEEEPISKKKKPTKVEFVILDETGDTVRNFTAKPDTGINRVVWDLSRNGPQWPSYNEPKKDADLPTGRRVLPGTYRVKLSYGDFSDSTKVVVNDDPRIKRNEFDIATNDEELRKVEELVASATLAFNRLKDLQKVLDLVNSQINFLGLKKDTALKNTEKSVNESIKSLFKLFLTPKDFDGYDHVTVRVVNSLGRAMEYVSSSDGIPSESKRIAIVEAENRLKEAIDKINSFVESDWVDFMEKVKKLDINMFKTLQPLGVDKK